MSNPAQMRRYESAQCAVFHRVREAFGGLSNMAGGFPLVVNGCVFPTSEALYQAFRFPHRPDLQALIAAQASPMTAKQVARQYNDSTRPDWMSVRVAVMRWCLRAKLIQHPRTFGEILDQTDGMPIVEKSTKDTFWGARPHGSQLIGHNVLGRLLMELREIRERDGIEGVHLTLPVICDALILAMPARIDGDCANQRSLL